MAGRPQKFPIYDLAVGQKTMIPWGDDGPPYNQTPPWRRKHKNHIRRRIMFAIYAQRRLGKQFTWRFTDEGLEVTRVR
jgi:hypothetical protein